MYRIKSELGAGVEPSGGDIYIPLSECLEHPLLASNSGVLLMQTLGGSSDDSKNEGPTTHAGYLE